MDKHHHVHLVWIVTISTDCCEDLLELRQEPVSQGMQLNFILIDVLMVSAAHFSKASESDDLIIDVRVLQALINALLAFGPSAVLFNFCNVIDDALKLGGDHWTLDRCHCHVQGVEYIGLYEISIRYRNVDQVLIFWLITLNILSVRVLLVLARSTFLLLPTDVDDGLEQTDSSEEYLVYFEHLSIEALNLGDFVRIQNDLHEVLKASILLLSLTDVVLRLCSHVVICALRLIKSNANVVDELC